MESFIFLESWQFMVIKSQDPINIKNYQDENFEPFSKRRKLCENLECRVNTPKLLTKDWHPQKFSYLIQDVRGLLYHHENYLIFQKSFSQMCGL
jgi:hypothetical protein